MDFDWPKRTGDEDDDVDMIPLIDISLVLLIFFMMTMTVAAISRIQVPDMANAFTIETNPGIIRIDIDLQGRQARLPLGLGTAARPPKTTTWRATWKLSSGSTSDCTRRPSRPRCGSPPTATSRTGRRGGLKGLERRQEKSQIRDYAVEVNERAQAMNLWNVRHEGSPSPSTG